MTKPKPKPPAGLFPVEEFTERLPPRRLSVQPLLDRFGGNTDALAKASGFSRRAVQRWVHEGLDFGQADEVCTRAGENPERIWPDWNYDDPYEEDKMNAEIAGIRLDPGRKPLALHAIAQPLVDDLTRLVMLLDDQLDDDPVIPEELQPLYARVLAARATAEQELPTDTGSLR